MASCSLALLELADVSTLIGGRSLENAQNEEWDVNSDHGANSNERGVVNGPSLRAVDDGRSRKVFDFGPGVEL
jgi:hypothetical protein